jgi:CubicO group peptidase (beta-lactamase class C family)
MFVRKNEQNTTDLSVFTSVMVQQLAEEGKIKLEAPLSNWFPDVPNAQRITLLNLLQHSSGLHNFTDDEAYIEWMAQPQSQAKILQLFAEQKLDFEPGT